MVFTRSQTENLSRDKLVEELLKLLDVSSELSDPSENSMILCQNVVRFI